MIQANAGDLAGGQELQDQAVGLPEHGRILHPDGRQIVDIEKSA